MDQLVRRGTVERTADLAFTLMVMVVRLTLGLQDIMLVMVRFQGMQLRRAQAYVTQEHQGD